MKTEEKRNEHLPQKSKTLQNFKNNIHKEIFLKKKSVNCKGFSAYNEQLCNIYNSNQPNGSCYYNF